MFNLIRKTTGIAVKQDPAFALLNHWIPQITKPTQALIHFILLGAKMTIARVWKSPSVSYRLTKQKISLIVSQEKIFNTILDTAEKFKLTWEPSASHFGVSL